MEQNIIILAGPTASGKSALALDIAQAVDVVIINADSKQLYREIPLITAQPSPDEQQQAPHALYGCVSAAEHCSAGRWLDMVKQAIEDAWEQEKLPLLVGGTGMYIKSLVEGISPIPDVEPAVRRQARELFARLGNEAFHKELAALDPQMAERLEVGDSQRVVRAYEVVKQTGKSLAYWQDLPMEKVFNEAQFSTFFLSPEHQKVYDNCNGRFEKMVENGVIDEVRALDTLRLDEELPAMKAHGVPEIRAYLKGDMTLEDAITQAQRNTRHYIKRQFTWFRHQMPDAIALEGEGRAAFEAVLRCVGGL